jgi:hypothetical protein
LEVAFFDHWRETTINHPKRNQDDPFEEAFDDAFEDTFQDSCEEGFDDAFGDALEDAFEDALDDPFEDTIDDAFDVDALIDDVDSSVVTFEPA